jgi:hypothetical protein
MKEMKMLPADGGTAAAAPSPAETVKPPASSTSSGTSSGTSAATSARAIPALRQMADMPRDELDHLADEYGLDPTRYKTRQQLVTAIHDRRQLIAALDREALLDIIRWGRRPVTVNATHEQLAQEIARIKTMKFHGLSQRGLVAMARLRGIDCRPDDPVPVLVRKLRKQEGLFSKFNRKRRAVLGALVCKIVGDDAGAKDYQFLPPDGGPGSAGGGGGTIGSGPRAQSLKDDIEEAGLFSGITNRLKKTADGYVNQKLDEIEARIDRKLDEIDRRLAEWRDKEIANRIRILKITLWSSVIVAVLSLIYTYFRVYGPAFFGG